MKRKRNKTETRPLRNAGFPENDIALQLIPYRSLTQLLITTPRITA